MNILNSSERELRSVEEGNRGGATIGTRGGVMHTPPFSNVSFYCLDPPHLRTRGSALGGRVVIE